MPGIGSLIREIAVEISEMWESKQTFAQLNNALREKKDTACPNFTVIM